MNSKQRNELIDELLEQAEWWTEYVDSNESKPQQHSSVTQYMSALYTTKRPIGNTGECFLCLFERELLIDEDIDDIQGCHSVRRTEL